MFFCVLDDLQANNFWTRIDLLNAEISFANSRLFLRLNERSSTERDFVSESFKAALRTINPRENYQLNCLGYFYVTVQDRGREGRDVDGRGGRLGEESAREGDWWDRELIEHTAPYNRFWTCAKRKRKKMNCRCCIVLIAKKKLGGRGISVLEDICTLKFLYTSADPPWRGQKIRWDKAEVTSGDSRITSHRAADDGWQPASTGNRKTG